MKSERHNKILEIIAEGQTGTQEELAERLRACGFSVTQATVSRDIRELNLTKVASSVTGKQVYSVMNSSDIRTDTKFLRVLKDGYVSMDHAENILVIKTVSGMAMAVGAALDAMDLPEMVGCIAGDDTVMCAIRTTQDTLNVMKELKKLLDIK